MGRRKSSTAPTRTVRLYTETADQLATIEKGIGITAAEYVKQMIATALARDVPRADRLIREREKVAEKITPPAPEK